MAKMSNDEFKSLFDLATQGNLPSAVRITGYRILEDMSSNKIVENGFSEYELQCFALTEVENAFKE